MWPQTSRWEQEQESMLDQTMKKWDMRRAPAVMRIRHNRQCFVPFITAVMNQKTMTMLLCFRKADSEMGVDPMETNTQMMQVWHPKSPSLMTTIGITTMKMRN